METALAVQKFLNVLLSVAILAICLAILGKYGIIEKFYSFLLIFNNKYIIYGGGGQQSLMVSKLALRHSGPRFNPQHSQIISGENVDDVAETNQLRCIEES